MMAQLGQSELAQLGTDLVLAGKCEMRPVLATLNPVDVAAMHTARINKDRDDGDNSTPSYSSESEDDSAVADPDYHPTPDDDDQRRPSGARDRRGAAAPWGGKGRRKVKIELVKNKTRRYATFSKRKIGIMKKAHELAMLTGSQVLLVVVSETGHVYTNATRKLQPMLTGKEGKSVIQTCLNSPDPPSHYDPSRDERISSRGYEEGRRTEAAASLLNTTPTASTGAPQSTEPAAPSTTTMPLGSVGLSSLPITAVLPSDFSSYVPTGTAVMCNNSPHTVLYPSNTAGAVDVGRMHFLHNGQWIPMVPQCSS